MKTKPKFPVRTKRKTKLGVVETLDTGLYIRKTVTRRGITRQDIAALRPPDPLKELAEIESDVETTLEQPELAEHIREDADKLLRTIRSTRNYILRGQTLYAATRCLEIGRRYEQLCVRESEALFASGRASQEAACQPRGEQAAWLAVRKYQTEHPDAPPRTIFLKAYQPAGGKAAELWNFRNQLYRKRAAKKVCS